MRTPNNKHTGGLAGSMPPSGGLGVSPRRPHERSEFDLDPRSWISIGDRRNFERSLPLNDDRAVW